MADQASPEQKLNIATYFVMSSPTDEVQDVVADVIKLVNDPTVLTDEAIVKILHDYNCEQMVVAPDPANSKNMLMVSSYGQVDPQSYVDPNSGRVLRFDHRKQKFTEVTENKQVLDEKVAKYRAAIQKAMDAYVSQNYKAGKAVVSVFATDSGKINICISARNVSRSNFWTGGWRAVYSFNASSGNQKLKGAIKVNVHYYEDGNVQLRNSLEPSADVKVSNEDATAAEVSKAIASIETSFHQHLTDMYVKMHNSTFKAMRRFYPVTRTPMVWNTSTHSLASEVTTSR